MAQLSISLDSNGKHFGTVELGETRLPIASIRNGVGPTLWINAGSHGDEYEGPIALWRLLSSLDTDHLRGHLIVTPALNPPALAAVTRISPLDRLDLNRSFPGDKKGSVTQRIAAFATHNLLPRADAVIDLHAAGSAVEFVPHVMLHPAARFASAEAHQRSVAAARAFGMPAILTFDEPDSSGMLDTQAERAAKAFLCVELGFGAMTTGASVARAMRGVLNMLHFFGLMQGRAAPVDTPDEYVLAPDGYVAASAAGLVEFHLDIGARVERGATICSVHALDRLGAAPTRVLALADGTLFARRRVGFVDRGDLLAGIVRTIDGEHS
jgi:N2-acetyl-L-2,4-diaminobutanoate deacetylase